MKLIIKNLGPIKNCAIDLSKQYYFFIGYNNTGKTYLSKLLYEIFNEDNLQDFTKEVLFNIPLTKEYSIVLTEEFVSTILQSFATFIKDQILPKSLKTNGENAFLLKDLDIRFEFDMEKDIKKMSLTSSAAISLRGMDMTENRIDIYTLVKVANSLDVQCQFYAEQDIANSLPNDFFDHVARKTFEQQVHTIRQNVPKNLIASTLSLLLQNKEKPFFLPANRIFILENADDLIEQDNKRNEELARNLLELLESNESTKEKLGNAVAKNIAHKNSHQISQLVREVAKLRKHKDETFIKNGSGFFDDLLTILSKLMGGEISMNKLSSLSNWEEKYRISDSIADKNRDLSLSLASSSVNQLSTLFLYLKYWAKAANNFLMIDEPEENLHPKSQIQLLDLLLTFANKGNKLLLTTHSPLVAEIINNYLVLSQLDNRKKMAAELNLMDINLSPQTAAIYFFNGTDVVAHKVGEYGTTFVSFKEAQDIVYGIGDVLGEQMFYQLNKN